jgi:hypothetical protein
MELICLANSRMHGERCIAGLRTDTGEWIRPVSQTEHGELTYLQRNLGAAREPRNFDVIRIGFANPWPTSSQPENWSIDGTGWQLVRRPASPDLHALLSRAIYSGTHLFGTLSDRVPAAMFLEEPATESLALVKPENLRWQVNHFGNARVLFTTCGDTYNLAVTDPLFDNQITQLGEGFHRSTELGIEDEDRMLFTISLGKPFHPGGEPFQQYCYKLVATVLILPLAWPNIP